MSSNMMTLIGSLNAAIIFTLANLPATSPYYVKIAVGAVGAFVSAYLGITNRGNTVIPQEVIVKVEDKSHAKPLL